jgi:hypothetical protein
MKLWLGILALLIVGIPVVFYWNVIALALIMGNIGDGSWPYEGLGIIMILSLWTTIIWSWVVNE